MFIYIKHDILYVDIMAADTYIEVTQSLTDKLQKTSTL